MDGSAAPLSHCQKKLNWLRNEVLLQWVRVLRRRSQRHRLYWSYLRSRSWFELPYPATLHATVRQSETLGEPGAENPHAGF